MSGFATYDPRSPYYITPQVNQYVDYLDMWQPQGIAPSPDDTLLSLDPRYDRRPDLLSYDLYGTPSLWWVFAMRNPDVIKDPIYDFKAGIVIYAPVRDNLGALI